MFTLDKAAIAKWIREDEDEPYVPDGGFCDEHPAADIASLLDEAAYRELVRCPEGWTIQAIAIDEIEASGLVVTIGRRIEGEPWVALTTGWTELKRYIDRADDGPVLVEPGERAAEFLARVVVEANVAYERRAAVS